MIRFIPDTLWEAVLRPLAMVAPNGYVYTEIVAPDFRFLVAVVLAVLVGIHLLMRRGGRSQPLPGSRALLALGVLIAVAFVPWLATSGNGRYFMPFLILVGPICIALAIRLPVTRPMCVFVVALTLAAQGLALAQNNPWKQFDGWTWIAWKDGPYFEMDAAPAQAERDVTYVTIATLTYSLVAPMFPPSARWVNLSAFNWAEDLRADVYYKRMDRLLSGGNLRLLQRAQVMAMDPVTLGPDDRAVQSMNFSLGRHGLRISDPASCKLLRASSLGELTTVPSEVSEEQRNELVARAGFWSCALVRDAAVAPKRDPSPAELHAKKVFARAEQLCPRFFTSSGHHVAFSGTTWVRGYPASDSVLMLENGELYVKYERALNPQLLGRAEDLLKPDARIDCLAIKGRSGMPWERKI